MKSIISILLVLGMAVPSVFGAVSLSSPSSGATVQLQQDGHKTYFAKSPTATRWAYMDSDAGRSAMITTTSRPKAVRFSWSGGTAPYTVTIKRTRDNSVFLTQTTSSTSVDLYNFEIGRRYSWTVKDASNAVSASREFVTECDAPRFLRVGLTNVDNFTNALAKVAGGKKAVTANGTNFLPNFRDVGGVFTADRTQRMKQGIVYRSYEYEKYGADYLPFGVDTDLVGGWLGIKTDLDLRGAGEVAGLVNYNNSKSPLNTTAHPVAWINKQITKYDTNNDPGVIDWVNGNGDKYPGVGNPEKEALLLFTNTANFPLVFHCMCGQDRTGCLALYLYAILGVDDDTMLKSWEASSFFQGDRNTSASDPGFRSFRIQSFIDGVRAYGNASDTLAACTLKMLKAKNVVTDATIASIRANLLETDEFCETPSAGGAIYSELVTDGVGWFDTGYHPNLTTTKIEMKFRQLAPSNGKGVGGYYHCDTNELYVQRFNSYAIGFKYNGIYTANAFTSASNTTSDIVLWTKGNQISYNGTTVTSSSAASSATTTESLKLLHGIGDPYPSDSNIYPGVPMRLYYCRIYENNTLVKEYLPAKTASGAATLYENIGGTFLNANDAGGFTTGGSKVRDLDGGDTPQPVSDKKGFERAAEENRPPRVLVIGNSFTQGVSRDVQYKNGQVKETRTHFPTAVRAMGKKIDYCALYRGGSSIQQHYEGRSVDGFFAEVDWSFEDTSAAPAWAPNGEKKGMLWLDEDSTTQNNANSETLQPGSGVARNTTPADWSLEDILNAVDWDVVMIQEASVVAPFLNKSSSEWTGVHATEPFRDYGTGIPRFSYGTHLQNYVAYLRNKAPHAELWWHQTWALPPDTTKIDLGTVAKRDWMYNAIATNAQYVATTYGAKIMPTGYAVQLYRYQLPVAYPDTANADPCSFDKRHINGGYNIWGSNQIPEAQRYRTYLQMMTWCQRFYGMMPAAGATAYEPTDANGRTLMRSCAQQAGNATAYWDYGQGGVLPDDPPVVDPTAYGADDTAAATYTWKGNTGYWKNTTEWTPSAGATYGIPNQKNCATASFPASGSFTCTLDQNAEVVGFDFKTPGGTLVLDNHTLKVCGKVAAYVAYYFSDCSTGAAKLVLKGANTGLLTDVYGVNSVLGSFSDASATGTCTIRWEVPAANWSAAPLRTLKGDAKIRFGGNVVFEVDATALGVPASGVTVTVPLAAGTAVSDDDGSPDGVLFNNTTFAVVKARSTVLCASGATAELVYENAALSLRITAAGDEPPDDPPVDPQPSTTISLTAPANGSTVALYTASQKQFLALTYPTIKTQYTGFDASMTNKYIRQKTTFSWSGASGAVTLRIVRAADNASFYEKAFAAGTTSAQVNNLEVGTAYTWSITDTTGTASATFTTEVQAPRIFYSSRVSSMRDLGGWTGLQNRRVKQGELIRSAEMDNSGAPCRFSEDELAFFHDVIGVRSDIDLRDTARSTGVTPLTGATWYGCPIDGFDYHLITSAGGDNFTSFRDAVGYVLDAAKRPLIFHCNMGRDRTGALAGLTLALLGVSADDIYRDYRIAEDMATSASFNLDIFLGDLTAAFPAATLAESAKRYCTEELGFTSAQVEAFRAAMLPGYESGSEPEPSTLAIAAPANGATVALYSAAQKQYFDLTGAAIKTAYTGFDASMIDPMLHTGVTLSWTGASGAVTVTVRRASDSAVIWSAALPAGTASYVARNLELGVGYSWTVTDATSASVTASFTTETQAPRVLSCESVASMRDLGGWTGLQNCRVKQGELFRTGQMDVKDTGVILTAAEKAFLKNVIGIKTDLDFRYSSETTGLSGSPIDSSVAYFQFPIEPYALGTFNESEDNPYGYMRLSFRKAFDASARPLIFHCKHGRDRTGTFAALTLALLGVSVEDICREYRVAGDFPQGGGKYQIDELLTLLGTQFPAATPVASAERYFKEALGFTAAEIEQFRSEMLVGYVSPSPVDPPDDPEPPVDPTEYGAADTAAATYTWKGFDGPWEFTTNWTPSASATRGIPDSSAYATAVVPASGTTVTLTGTRSVKMLSFANGGNTLAIAGGALSVSGALDRNSYIGIRFAPDTTGDAVLAFSGAAPSLDCTYAVVRQVIGAVEPASGTVTLRYTVPAAGWSQAPLRASGNDSKILIGNNVRFDVDVSALGVPASETTVPLAWGKAKDDDGVTPDGINFYGTTFAEVKARSTVVCAAGAMAEIICDAASVYVRVVAGASAAEIGGTAYATIAEACAAAQPGDTITLGRAPTAADKLVFKAGVTVDFNGQIETLSAGTYEKPEWFDIVYGEGTAAIALNTLAKPTVGDGVADEPFTVDADTVEVVVGNVKPGLYYALVYSATLEGLAAAMPTSWYEADSEGELAPLTLPKGGGAAGFYRVVAADVLP